MNVFLFIYLILLYFFKLSAHGFNLVRKHLDAHRCSEERRQLDRCELSLAALRFFHAVFISRSRSVPPSLALSKPEMRKQTDRIPSPPPGSEMSLKNKEGMRRHVHVFVFSSDGSGSLH